MLEWLERLLSSHIPALLDLLSNLWWLLGLLFAGLIWVASRLGLWKRCSKGLLKNWFHQLEHPDESVRSKARQKLTACGERTVLFLVDTLYKTDSDKRRALAVDVLCEIGIPALRSLLAARKEESMARIVDEALEKKLPRVVRDKQHEQEHASVWKRIIRSKQILDELITLLNDSDPIVQEGVALALGQYPQLEVVKALGPRLYPTECRYQAVREMVANSLGRIKRAEAIPFLEIGLRDRSYNVRIAACQALSQIKQPEAIPALEEVLLPFNIPLVRMEAAKALGHIGGAKAMEILSTASQILPNGELKTLVNDELAKLQRKLCGEKTT
ncbi:MAG: HEAT repeat domain-containing protein [candidate division KSB1 bacterium]|nr:HEAT repeat domain-containing protein [candidate division KSB1 bacterium]